MIDKAFFSHPDIRDQALYQESQALYQESQALIRAFHQPGTDHITDALDITASPCGQYAGFTGVIFNDLDSAPVNRACIVDIASAKITRIAHSGNNDRCPRWSPADGKRIAFLSDRLEAGNYQLYLIEATGTGELLTPPAQNGIVEQFSWSPDGRHILMVVAGFGADLAGSQGGTATATRDKKLPDWIPSIETADADNLWRWLSVYDIATGEARRLNRKGLNIWEAAWLGNDSLLAVCSKSHSEGSWYSAELYQLSLNGEKEQCIYTSTDQIGIPTGSPNGKVIALIEAVCSDRLVVCGHLLLIDPANGTVRKIETNQTDISHIHWRNEHELVYAGHRSLECVVGEVDAESGKSLEHWHSVDRVLGAWYPSVWPLKDVGVVAISEACNVPPELVVIKSDNYRVVTSFASDASIAEHFNKEKIEPVHWNGRDGLEIHGWIIKPEGKGPFPLVMDIHGGPVWTARNRWIARQPGSKLLVDKGYAYFYPNARGSSGRGLEFARKVQGDMGGEDSHDFLTGLDHLVAEGIADPNRLGVTGISYGGFMSAWLITQDKRFAAAVPISPICNWYSQHRTCQIPEFDSLFLQDDAYKPNGKYFHRSPVMFTRQVKTPTLQLAGQLDKNTPPTQALEFHRGLIESGVESVCIVYPKAGHGIRTFPDVIDHAARKVGWFLYHMPLDTEAT